MRIATPLVTLHKNNIVRLLSISALLQLVTYTIIGLSSKGGYYSETVDTYLNYPYHLRKGLIIIAHRALLYMDHRAMLVNNEFIYNMRHGGIHVAYECLGFGLMSLWTGFVLSYRPITTRCRVVLICIGLLVINITNILRMIIVFIAPFKLGMGIDNHGVYNVVLHTIILLMGLMVVKKTQKMSSMPGGGMCLAHNDVNDRYKKNKQ
ncbi:hypothetical protein GCM10023093_26200 [Nemorincola caseinilytica]|uniref:Exosortase/archaeosortase family protein n=1 Tax=Nemorincola caseinilytica TaxID=2054315 RepID=A0ABP8NNZ9_9BACT